MVVCVSMNGAGYHERQCLSLLVLRLHGVVQEWDMTVRARERLPFLTQSEWEPQAVMNEVGREYQEVSLFPNT
jgi:hypothetical protein